MSEQPTPRRRKSPPPLRPASVVSTEALTPRMMRLVVGGPGLDGLEITEPAASVRLLIAWPGDEFELPEWNGNEFLLADGRRPALRTFTPVRLDDAARTLTIDIVRHPGGAISDWVETTRPGDPVAISGPGRGEELDGHARRYVLLGDETAIPAIRQLHEVMPEGVDTVTHIEIESPDATLDIGGPVEWHVAGARPGARLLEAISATDLGDDDRIWAAGEAAAVQAIRKHLFNEREITRHHTTIRGYWKVPRE